MQLGDRGASVARVKALRVVPLVALLTASGACTGDAAGPGDRIAVVTTVSPITNIVATVGGDRIFVTGIVPEGTNSHTFEPRPSDAKVLASARIVFANGLNLEEPTLKLARATVRAGTKIVELGEDTIAPSEQIFDFSFPKSEGDPNPHLWTNPAYAKRFAQIVRDELVALDPAGVAGFDANYVAFAARIDQLDQAIRTATATVPAGNRKLLTYHDSFPYFARAYGWTIVGAVQPSDFSEPTPRDVAELIEQIRRERVPAIFGSEVFPSDILQQIARESGAKYVDALRDDDLPGSKGDPQHSYFGLMVFDFTTIVKALGGDASALESVDRANIGPETNASYRE